MEKEMPRFSKACLILIGVMFIFIGALHLNVHFNELVSDDLQKRLSFTTPVMGDAMDVYLAWQGFSFMMGVSFVVIGLLCAIQGFRAELPSTMTFLTLIGMFCAVIFSGLFYFGEMQIYGGAAGLAITLIGFVARLRRRASPFRS